MLWVETQHPKFHELTVTWRVNGVAVPGTGNSRNLELADLDVGPGDVVQVTVKDETDWVRDPAFKDGPRMTQTRQWTVGAPLAPSSPAPRSRSRRPPTTRSRGDEVVFVETTHPTASVHDVTWRLNGAVVAERQPAQLRPRRAEPRARDALAQRHGRHADDRPGPWTTRCPRRRGRCRRR